MTAQSTQSAATQTSNPERVVETRRITFEEGLAQLPKHFAADGDLIMSHLMASLSAVFPDGEDFFVRSVRSYRDRITDPDLKRQVTGFIGQESVHGREHRALNDRLAELGYPVKQGEAITRWGLELREKVLPPMSNLAATAALEHFTATLAELVLTNPEMRATAAPGPVHDLFLWHALEESEHKAVAFDVYKAVGGSEWLRTLTMNLLTVGFIGGMALSVVLSMLFDRSTYNPRKLKASAKRFRRSPILSKALWRKLRDFNRRDFHPDDYDTTELVEQWRSELFGASGTMNDRLTSTSPAA